MGGGVEQERWGSEREGLARTCSLVADLTRDGKAIQYIHDVTAHLCRCLSTAIRPGVALLQEGEAGRGDGEDQGF